MFFFPRSFLLSFFLILFFVLSIIIFFLLQTRMSVCEVTHVDLYDAGFPKEGGLNDPRMGTTDYRVSCSSCNMDCKQCPGHFGHMRLQRPVYHVGFIRVVLSVLR